jgi:hypothetical protein
METLLNNDFTGHYGLSVSTTVNIRLETTEPYFEIEDDVNKETQLHTTVGSGMAVYSNVNKYSVVVINYDKFVTGLSPIFQHKRKRCDLIVYTDIIPQYFLLNELKDRRPKPKVKTKAVSQLLVSLTDLMNVPTIHSFINSYSIKRCCFFNKQATAPPSISATSAFNRFNTIAINGIKMSNPAIEAFGFELYEYSGNQVYSL